MQVFDQGDILGDPGACQGDFTTDEIKKFPQREN